MNYASIEGESALPASSRLCRPWQGGLIDGDAVVHRGPHLRQASGNGGEPVITDYGKMNRGRFLPSPATVCCMLGLAMGVVCAAGAAQIPSLMPVAGNPFPGLRGAPQGRLARQVLTDSEQQEAVQFHLELKLQHFEELQSRIAKGSVLQGAELEAYLPSADAYSALKSWLLAQGFTVTLESRFRNALFARGTVQQAATAFQTTFGRVATSDGEFTSALIDPSLPDALAPCVAAIRGLQPHLRRHFSGKLLAPAAVPQGYLDPATLAAYYNVPAALTGAGQTIAIIGDSAPLVSDLTLYWSTCSIPQSAGNFTVVPVQGGPGTDMTNQSEVTMDVEWASSIAPGAAVRLYATPGGLNSNTEAAACTQILNDLADFPTIHEVSESYGGPEGVDISSTSLLAAQGVSYFACSGDWGSNPNYTTSRYDSSSALMVEYPASDAYVTGVGGTTLKLDIDGHLESPETGWSLGSSYYASGGGTSSEESRPSWQTGTGVPSGSMRCVPDVSAIAMNSDSTSGGLAPFVILNGKDSAYGGTSLATPIWAGICALVNQARLNVGLTAVGLLNARIYPLIGTNAFNDMTSGNNGAYSCTAGFDMVTGIGSPNIANLVSALVPPPQLPIAPVANGSGSISVTAPGAGPGLTYQWYLDGTAIAGATNPTFSVIPTAANQGIYTVNVTNNGVSATNPVGMLTVCTNAWLTNLSARANVETGANPLIAGFVTTGTASKCLLIRADGPALGEFGIIGFLADPRLTLDSGATTFDTSTSWASSLDAVFAQVGAFSLAAGSHDTALLESVAPGAYTAQVASQTTNSGIALAEIYDADAGAPANRLINLSARASIGTGADILIGGFVIDGSTPQTVIIRGDGPSLVEFGLLGALPATTLSLSNCNGPIATNSGWCTAPVAGPEAKGNITVQPLTAALSAKVGAFALTAGSKDSAIVVTLPPGAYTAQVSGVNGSTGIALLEVYELR
jgi:kumamolisin